VPNLAVLPLPHLPRVVAHQYRGDPLDLSVMLQEFTTPPLADPCTDIARRLAAVAAIIARSPYRPPSRRALRAAIA
jgi:hypothetical protein